MRRARSLKFDIRKAPQRAALRSLLDRAHEELVEGGAIYNDAQAPARRFREIPDLELAAFICAIIAYGRVAHIKVSIARILDRLGDQPVKALIAATNHDLKKMCRGWSHRFNTENDIYRMLQILRKVYSRHGSLEQLIARHAPTGAAHALEILIEQLEVHAEAPIPMDDSFWFFLPRPSRGSACKRLNLYLRWMVGRGSSDFGIWTCLSPAQLIVPVDTHVHAQALILGMTKRKNGDWKTAEEITAALRCLDPQDPTRFDFALCHLGIRGVDILKLVADEMSLKTDG